MVWTDAHGRYWVATTYDTVRRDALDAETFAKAAEDRTEAGTHIPPGSFRGIGR
jgi:hypothetical protein